MVRLPWHKLPLLCSTVFGQTCGCQPVNVALLDKTRCESAAFAMHRPAYATRAISVSQGAAMWVEVRADVDSNCVRVLKTLTLQVRACLCVPLPAIQPLLVLAVSDLCSLSMQV